MADSTLPQRPVQNFSLTTFRTLCNNRDAAAYHVVGETKAALAYLNLGDAEKAKCALLAVLEHFQTADEAIDSYRKGVSCGNAAA